MSEGSLGVGEGGAKQRFVHQSAGDFPLDPGQLCDVEIVSTEQMVSDSILRPHSKTTLDRQVEESCQVHPVERTSGSVQMPAECFGLRVWVWIWVSRGSSYIASWSMILTHHVDEATVKVARVVADRVSS